MLLNEYIADYFLSELKLDSNSDIAKSLRKIQSSIYLFLFINGITCLYAFKSLFDNWFTAILATLVFQFIFLMVYIVLFSTIRKSDFQKQVQNRKIKAKVKINNQDFDASKFTTVQNTNIINQKTRGWGKVIFRLFLLLLLGTAPAVFFGLMIHHPFTNNSYSKKKQQFVSDHIKFHKDLKNKSNASTYFQFDSLSTARKKIANQIDSLMLNPGPNGYYMEDIAWLKSRLKNFDDLNQDKLRRIIEKSKRDSIDELVYVSELKSHFENADFFQLRLSVTWEQYTITFCSSVIFFLYLLLLPFYRRYYLILKKADQLDNKLEMYYIKLIEIDYLNFTNALKNTAAYVQIQNCIISNNLDDNKKSRFISYLNSLNRVGDKFIDPAIKAIEREDKRIFIEKGGLGKYLENI